MKFPNIEIDEKQLIKVAKHFKIQEIYFFGSILRKDFTTDSDIDILISFKKDIHYSYFDLADLKQIFSDILNRTIDLVEKESLKNPYRRDNILKSARMIYAA